MFYLVLIELKLNIKLPMDNTAINEPKNYTGTSGC